MLAADKNTQFVICIISADAEDIEKGKIYRALVGGSANADRFLRVIDESNEGYLFPASYFVPTDRPGEAKKALLAI